MATDLGRVKSTGASKHDAFVAAQLAQAVKRIRLLDLTAGLLGFAALSLAYVAVMVLCDSKLLLSQQARQLSLWVFLAGAAVYLYIAVFRPLWLRVNPYYAARQVEQQLPQAKNSIVNWVDLHEQPLPTAIRGALGQRAAKDLARVDLDRAISGRRAAWMGGFAGLFAVVFITLFFLIGPAPFVSLLKRTFNPFESVGVSTRTRLTLLKPEGGDATITVGRGINFAVEVGGKVPDLKSADAVKLLYRYEEGDPWLERRLMPERSGEWTTSLSAIEVKNGFWYKVTGGDAATEEYRVGVRAAVAITDFLARYRFRPYVARADEVRRERELKALRGTEVFLRIRTNRALRDGRLEFESNGRAGAVNSPAATVRGEIDPNEPHTLLVRFVLNEDGKYRLCFTSTESEAYRDPVSYAVTAIADQPPTVELTKPGQDIRLPADALLQLEGKAGDDIGVKSLVLRMRVVGGDVLRGRPYRSDEQLRLADGGYPRELEYKDFVDLSRVQNEKDQAVPLRGGMELEYWLEASDASDYPRPNVAESKHYRVLITEPEKNDPKKKQEQNQAEKDKKQHEQKQDQKLQKENQERQQQRQEQEARDKEEQNKSKDADKSASEKSQQKEGEQGNSGENKDNKGDGGENKQPNSGDNTQNNGQRGENKAGQGEANNGEQKSELSKEDQSIEDRIKKALEKQKSGQSGKGEPKPDKSDSGEGKGEQQNKGSGQPDTKPGEGKDKGQPQAGSDPSRGDGKGEKSEPKGGDPKGQGSAGKSGENKGKSEAASQQNKGKSSGDSQEKKDAGQNKPQPKDQGQGSAQNENKSAQSKGQQSKGEGNRKDDGKAEKKQGETKPSGRPNEGDKKEKGQNKSDSGSSARDATPKEVQDLARALQSKDAREREEAKRQLQRIAEEAADPEAGKKAEEALQKMGKPDGRGDNETPKKGNDSSGKSDGDGKKGEKNDGSKSAGPKGDKGDGKDEGKGPDPKQGQGDKKGRDPSSPEELPGPQESQHGNTPGGGGDPRDGSDKRVQPSDLDHPKQPAKPRDPRAAQMQLEDFAKQVNKDILKEAGVSEEAWKKYLDAKRKQLTPPDKPRPEATTAPRQAQKLPSMGGRTIDPAASGQGDAHGPDRGQPLPGYRDAFRKFTQEMSKNK